MMIHRVEKIIGGRKLTLETGRMAKQAHGATFLQYGETSVLATVVESPDPKEGVDFLPLFVDYRERAFAGGKIPGGFFKREGRPSDREVLSARLIDRPIRALFPDGYHYDVVVMVTVLSSDQENPADILGLVGVSTAMALSQIPLSDQVAAVRVGYIDGNYVLNPTWDQLEASKLNLVVAGTRETIVMVEGGAEELPQEVVLGGLRFAREGIVEIIDLIAQIAAAAGVPKRKFTPPVVEQALVDKVQSRVEVPLDEIMNIADNVERETRYADLLAQV